MYVCPSPCFFALASIVSFNTHASSLSFSDPLVYQTNPPEHRSLNASVRHSRQLTLLPSMSMSVQPDNKNFRLDLQQQIQRGIELATQLCHAAGKEDLNSKEWTANQIAANELLRIFETMGEKVVEYVLSFGLNPQPFTDSRAR